MRVAPIVGLVCASMLAVPISRAIAGDARARVRLGDAVATSGGTVDVPLILENPADAVRGVQLTVAAASPHVSLQAVRATDRAQALRADAQQQDDGSIRIVLISLGGGTIAAGTGTVLEVGLGIRSSAPAQPIHLDIADARIAGTDGAITATTAGGTISVHAPAMSRSGCGIGTARRAWSPDWLWALVPPLWLAGRRVIVFVKRHASAPQTKFS